MALLKELNRRNVVRVAAAYAVLSWLLIQVASTIFPLFGFDETPSRIVVILLVIGFIPSLLFSWVFEWTPEGLKREVDVDRSRSITRETGKKLDRVIMVVLVIALSYFAFDKFVLSDLREAALLEQARQEGRAEALVESYGDKSIAVLAFEDMSPDQDQEHLGDGIAEELLSLLAEIPELRVISRTSAFSFKGKDVEIPEIARRLNVAHILEGSVRKSASRLRVTVQLIDARADTHLWAEVYDRPFDDIFVIQDDIAAQVTEQLKLTLLGDSPQVKVTDPEAYALYLQARHLFHVRTAEGWEQSVALLQKGLTVDPNYAPAWRLLAADYFQQWNYGLRPADEAFALARQAAEKSAAIDPEYAGSYSALAWIEINDDRDLAQAVRHMQQALQLAPTDTEILGSASGLLAYLGRVDEALAIDKYVALRDPLNAVNHYSVGIMELGVGNWDESLEAFRTVQRLSPDFMHIHSLIGEALLFKGEPEAALAEFMREPDEFTRLMGQAMTYHALSQQADYEATLRKLIARMGDEPPEGSARGIAEVYAFAGDVDAAFEWLEVAFEQNDVGLSWIYLFPTYQPLRFDPRWSEFLRQIGSSPEQLEAIEFEVNLPK